MIFINNKKIKNDDSGQLLLLGGVMLTILIISLAVISTSVSDIYISVDNTDFIKSEYDNIRREFGLALESNLIDKLEYVTPGTDGDNIVLPYFNDVKDVFIFTESLYGNYFDANFIRNNFSPEEEAIGMIVELTFDNGKESITEEVEYVFSIY